MWLLQLFFHHKHAAILRDDINALQQQQVDNTFDLNCEQLTEQLEKWVNNRNIVDGETMQSIEMVVMFVSGRGLC